MAVVLPFRGLKSRPDKARDVASPPYDVLSTKEAREMAKGNPDSFLHVNKAEIEFDDNADPYGEEVYKRAAENLNRLRRSGVMIRDPKPCFYIYRLTMFGRSQTGLVAGTSIEEYELGKIKKHEHTRPEKVRDRADHISTVGAQVGPVLTAFRYDAGVDRLFKNITSSQGLMDFCADDGIRHEFWVVNHDRMIQDIVKAFAGIESLYIADGHHRSESAAEVCRREKAKNPKHAGNEPYNFFLNVLFPDRELIIMPYNRVVKDLKGMSLDEVLKRASEKFTISLREDVISPEKLHTFGFYCEKKWYLLEAKQGTFDPKHPTRSIDASILAENLIDPILGITDPRRDKRIDFVGGIRGTSELVRLVDSGEFKAAISLYPTTIEQLLNVADRGEVMPPKSTWFEPKLRDGLVVYLLND
jgi:uncharacterized protein (DUF1015 family)